MKRQLKLITVCTVIALALGIAACNPVKPSPTPTATEKKTDGIENKQHDFKGRTFRISGGLLHEGNAWKSENVPDVRMRQRVEFLQKQCNGNYEFVGDGTYATDQGTIIPSMIAGNPLCDVTNVVPFSFHIFLTKDCIVPIEDYVKETEMENPDLWDQTCQEMFSVKGNRYVLVPRYSESLLVGQTKVVFFNQTLLTESNVTDNLYQLQQEKKWTWDKFSEIAIKVTKDSNSDGKTDYWGAGGNGYSLLLGFVISNNGNLFSNNEQGLPDVMFDKQPAKEAFQYLVDLTVKKKAMRPRPIEEGGAIDIPLFIKGRVGMTAEYCNRIDPGIGGISTMKDDYGILLFPLAPNKSEYKMPFDYYLGWSVVSHVDEPKEVAQFISYFFRPLMTKEETAAEFDVTFSEYLRSEETMSTLNMITPDILVADQAGAYIVGGTDADATFLIIDGTERAFLGEQTVQQYYDEALPILKERLRLTWKGVLTE